MALPSEHSPPYRSAHILLGWARINWNGIDGDLLYRTGRGISELTLNEICNLAYHYLTIGKSEAEIAAMDLILEGEDDPQAVGKANQAAMQSLGMVGAIPARRKSV